MSEAPFREGRGSIVKRELHLTGQQLGRTIRQVFSPTASTDRERNARNLGIEVFFAAFLSAAAAFNAPFALRLGATNAEIGLLSSVPALLAILVTIPAGQFINRRAQRMPLLFWSLFVHRLGFLLAVVVPWLPFEDRGTVWVWLLILFTAPAHFFGVGWSAMLADVVPEVSRAQVFALRNILAAVGVTAGVFLAGRWLEHAVFPLNYQIMYEVGFIASMISLIYIARLRVPDAIVRKAPPARGGFRSLWTQAREAFTQHPDFVRFEINTLAHGIGFWMIGPIYVLYFVRTLGAAEGWLGLNNTIANLTPVIGFYLWQRGVIRWGENRVLRWTMGMIWLYPILVGLTPNLTAILAWGALNGLISPGTTLSHFPMLLKICPADQRPAYLGLHTTIMNIAAFLMPLLGVFLANTFGFRPVLIAGGIVCLAGSSLFIFRPLQTPDSLTARRAAAALPAAHAETN